MRIYAFKDDKIIHANSEDEAISIYKDIMANRYNGETRSFEELDELATKYYDNNDQNSFYYFSNDELALLWSKCMFTNSHPWGQAYDDEVYDIIHSLPNSEEIMKKANEYADEEEKNFKGEPFFKSDEESRKRSDETAELLYKVAQDLKKEYNIKDESLKESLASRLVDFIKDYDFYHYSDAREVGDSDEDVIKEMDKELSNPESAKKLLDSLIEMSKNENLDDEQKDIISSLISGVQSVVNNQKTESLKESSMANMLNGLLKKDDESLKESSDENWAVFAKDKSTGKEYCAGVYESKDYAYYWSVMDKNADSECGYGDFEYRVDKVPEFSSDLVKSNSELTDLKLANHKQKDESLKEGKGHSIKENSTDVVYFTETPDDHYVDVDFLFEDFEENYPGIVITGNDRLKDFGVEQFEDIFSEYDRDEDIISALEEKTGKKYDVALMRGYTQSEWQNVYYPVEEEKYIDELEAYYFGKVKEYKDDDNCFYLVLDDIAWKGTDAIKKELSEQSGIPVENIKIRKFNGYTRTANYVDEKLNEKSLKEDIETPYFKAFITNLGKYNEGELVGEWVEFPIDEDDFNEVLKKIGVSDEPDADGNYYEEFFVTDYDCNLNGFNWQDFGEYPSYDTLQEFGELIESIDDVEAVDNAYEVTGDLKEAIDGLEDGSIIYYPGIHSDSDLGYEIIDQIYGDDIPKDILDSYFDYEALGRDLGFDKYENSEYDDFDMEEATKEYIDENGYDEIKELDKFIDFKEMGEYLYDGDEDLTDEQYIEWAKNYVKENGYDDAEDYIDFESLGEWLKDNSLIDVPEQYISAGEYWCGDEYASDSDIGYAYVEAMGGISEISSPENYFDYEGFGRDLFYENFTLTSDGAIEQI